jgi:hypothetical protein
MLVLLDHGSSKNERDSSTLNDLAREFAHKLNYSEVGHLPRKGVRKHEIASPGQWHSKHRIHIGPLG